MATIPRSSARREVDYPTGDGKPMAETDVHRQDMIDLIQILQDRYQDDPMIYVTGNLLLFYEEGNKRKHISPDVFLVRGVPKLPLRDNYLVWEEGKGPDVVIELTSKSTRREDKGKKLELYRDVLMVPEYFQFDPMGDYLKPPMQGHRLVDGEYVPIEMLAGRLPSDVLGLHFERQGTELRLFDPLTGKRLPTRLESQQIERRRAQEEKRRADEQKRLREVAQREAHEERQRAADIEAENVRLRLEIEKLRKKASGKD